MALSEEQKGNIERIVQDFVPRVNDEFMGLWAGIMSDFVEHLTENGEGDIPSQEEVQSGLSTLYTVMMGTINGMLDAVTDEYEETHTAVHEEARMVAKVAMRQLLSEMRSAQASFNVKPGEA